MATLWESYDERFGYDPILVAQIQYNISSSEAKQAQPQCLCGVAPFFLYGVMRAILHFRLYFFRNNFRIAYLRNGLDLLRKVVLLVIIRLAAL